MQLVYYLKYIDNALEGSICWTWVNTTAGSILLDKWEICLKRKIPKLSQPQTTFAPFEGTCAYLLTDETLPSTGSLMSELPSTQHMGRKTTNAPPPSRHLKVSCFFVFLPLLEHLWITRQVKAFSKWLTSPCVASSQRALNRGSGRPGSSESRKERGQGECVGESADPECPPPSSQQYLQLHVQTIQLNLGSKDATSQVKGCSSAPGYSHLRSAAQKRKWKPGSRQEFSTHNLPWLDVHLREWWTRIAQLRHFKVI